MGNYGIKIAKEGNDITSTTPSDYHFWSKYRNKSIKAVGSINVTTTTDVDSAAVVGSFQHNFGYIPQFMVFVVNDINDRYINCDYDLTTTIGDDYHTETLTAYATSTHIYVSANRYSFVPMSGTWTGIANTYTFDYVLFMEEVETS